MKEERKTGRIILLVCLSLIVISYTLVKTNFLRYSRSYTGVIKDAQSGGPAGLIEISVGGQSTYTNRNGEYLLSLVSPVALAPFNRKPVGNITVTPTYDYEAINQPVLCRKEKQSLFGEQYVCSLFVYPQPFNVAARVLAAGSISGLKSDEEITNRLGSFWNLLSQWSKQVWGSRDTFIGAFRLYGLTLQKLGTQPTGSEVSREVKYVNQYNYLGKLLIDSTIAVVSAEITNASKQSSTKKLYFVKEDGLWMYLITDTPDSISSFNSRNSWVFNKR